MHPRAQAPNAPRNIALMTDTVPVEIGYRLCRREDLQALEWMGLFTRDRKIIHSTFAAQESGAAWMLLAVANEYPIAQVWIDVADRGSLECPRLWAVRVFPALQGAGIGTRMMSNAERLIGEAGARWAELGVERENEAAKRFYRRLGYRRAGKIVEKLREAGSERCVLIEHELMRKELPAPAPRASGRHAPVSW